MLEGDLVGIWDYVSNKERFGVICKIDQDRVVVQVDSAFHSIPRGYVHKPGTAKPKTAEETIKKAFWSIQGRWCRLNVHGEPIVNIEQPGLHEDVF